MYQRNLKNRGRVSWNWAQINTKNDNDRLNVA